MEIFFYGLVGGFLAELGGLFKLRHLENEAMPSWIRNPVYWVITISMMLAGGVLAVIYTNSGIDLKPLLAVNIGASAPLIISSLSSQIKLPTKID